MVESQQGTEDAQGCSTRMLNTALLPRSGFTAGDLGSRSLVGALLGSPGVGEVQEAKYAPEWHGRT